MRNSLQDQLLKAGLANKKQAVRAKKAKNNKDTLLRKGHEVVDEVAESVKAAELAKLEKDKRLNREKNEAAQKKAIQAQIRQLIEMNAPEARGEDEFRFDDIGVIKTIPVSQVQRKQLAAGVLAVVNFADGFELVSRAVAQKIMQRDTSVIACLHDKAEDSEDDDEYSDYQVPDDLMW